MENKIFDTYLPKFCHNSNNCSKTEPHVNQCTDNFKNISEAPTIQFNNLRTDSPPAIKNETFLERKTLRKEKENLENHTGQIPSSENSAHKSLKAVNPNQRLHVILRKEKGDENIKDKMVIKFDYIDVLHL